MKKLNRSILRKINYCIGIILSMLGITTFAACEMQCMYGTPSADFTISGRVENAQKRGIKGIEIAIKQTENPYNTEPFAKDTTDADGSFEMRNVDFPVNELLIVAHDIDSTDNGSYLSDSVTVTPEYKRDPDNSWHSTAIINDIVITLEENK